MDLWATPVQLLEKGPDIEAYQLEIISLLQVWLASVPIQQGRVGDRARIRIPLHYELFLRLLVKVLGPLVKPHRRNHTVNLTPVTVEFRDELLLIPSAKVDSMEF